MNPDTAHGVAPGDHPVQRLGRARTREQRHLHGVFREPPRGVRLAARSDPAGPRGRPVVRAFHIGADYTEELYCLGTVEIDAAVRDTGKIPFHLGHAIFADGVCKAIATSVILQLQAHQLHAAPFSDEEKALVHRIGDVQEDNRE